MEPVPWEQCIRSALHNPENPDVELNRTVTVVVNGSVRELGPTATV
jgi:hypothetical protein